MPSKLNVLYSYEYIRKSKDLLPFILNTSDKITHLMDCGAFSAWKVGATITLEEYLKFCRQVHGNVWQYIMLDVIANPDGSWIHWEKMNDAGLKPMPVWVEGMRLEQAVRMVDVNPYLCVPGGTSHQDKYIFQRFQQVYKATNSRAKIHGLGFVRHPEVFQLPLYSGDSSTFSIGQRFGTFKLYDTKKGFTQYPSPCLKTRRHPELNEYASRCGINADDVTKPELYTGGESFVAMQTCHSYLQFNDFATAKGFKFFFASTSVQLTLKIIAVRAHMTRDYFDYRAAKKLFQHLKAEYSNNPAATTVEIKKLLEK